MGFSIKNNMNVSFTIIPNNFIDEYMVKANGEFVKVYLYVQSQIQANREQNLSMSVIADKLECTEKDIQRAFAYWEKEGLLSLEMEENKPLPESQISKTSPFPATNSMSSTQKVYEPSHAEYSENYPASISHFEATKTPNYPLPYEASRVSDVQRDYETSRISNSQRVYETRSTEPQRIYETSSTTESQKLYDDPRATSSYRALEYTQISKNNMDTRYSNSRDHSVTRGVPSKAMLPPTTLQSQIEEAGLSQLAYMADTYFGKPLTPTDLNTLFYFHDQLHFSVELIEFLIEYCVSNDKRNMRYIENVALAWYKKHITTVEEAKEQIQAHNKNYYSVMRALGINNRSPIPSEAELIKKWLQTYNFELPIILEACKRTIQKTHQPSFAYADKILSSWYTSKVRTLDDIKTLDEEYQLTNPVYVKKGTDSSKAENRFHNFEQRNYDFDALEKQFDQQFFFQINHKNG